MMSCPMKAWTALDGRASKPGLYSSFLLEILQILIDVSSCTCLLQKMQTVDVDLS